LFLIISLSLHLSLYLVSRSRKAGRRHRKLGLGIEGLFGGVRIEGLADVEVDVKNYERELVVLDSPIYMCMHTYIHICTYICMHIYIYVYARAHTHTTHTHTHTHTHTYTHRKRRKRIYSGGVTADLWRCVGSSSTRCHAWQKNKL
jgi:hypothetical protein